MAETESLLFTCCTCTQSTRNQTVVADDNIIFVCGF